MQEVYQFIGVPPAPGVAQTCFSYDRERFGPGDHKIWSTAAVNGDSVGTGESVPAGLIPHPITDAINTLVDKLGYVPIGDDWGTSGKPSDPRVPDAVTGPALPPSVPTTDDDVVLYRSLSDVVAGMDDQFTSRWGPLAREKFHVVARTPTAGGNETRWVIDIGDRTVAADDAEADDADWNMVGSPEVWYAVLSSQANLQAALRRGELRYCSLGDDSSVVNQARIAMLADLLGFSPWGRTPEAQRDAAQVS
jgi:hypothetical protein